MKLFRVNIKFPQLTIRIVAPSFWQMANDLNFSRYSRKGTVFQGNIKNVFKTLSFLEYFLRDVLRNASRTNRRIDALPLLGLQVSHVLSPVHIALATHQAFG